MLRDLHSGESRICPQCEKIKPLYDFKDKSLITGVGRLCLECKSSSSIKNYLKTNNRRCISDSEISKSDTNKLLSFIATPEKYATLTHTAKEKVLYLETIKYKFNEDQLASYDLAYDRYVLAFNRNKEPIKKISYYNILEGAVRECKTVRIRYKGLWRDIDPYSINSVYLVANCHIAHDIRTFRVDRVQGAELLDSFHPDSSLVRMAQSKITQAPSYKGGYTYRRKY